MKNNNDCMVVMILPQQKEFEGICDSIEENIVKENYVKYGGTLRYRNLTYKSDYLFLALVDSVPVGYCSIVIENEDFYIYQIGVKKAFQQRGIGQSLMEHVMVLAKNENRDIAAHVREYNENSKKLFNRLGFEKISVEKDNGFYKFYQDKIALGGRG